MFTRFCLMTFFLIAAAPIFASAANDDFKVRLWPTSERTRLVIETSPPPTYKLFVLENPARLVLDIEDKHNDADFLNQASLRDAVYLGGLHVARHAPNTLRFVFTLKDLTLYEARTISPVAGYAHRLVVDLVPKNHPDPLLALIKSLQEEDATQQTTPSFLVVLDPGHGGEDPGAVSRKNAYEKDIVLAIAKKTQDEINRLPGMRAILSRSDDRFLPLARRVRIAHKLNADAFVSIHADSVESPKARGSSVFILSQRGASSKLARKLAQDANLSDVAGGNSDPQRHADLLPFSQDGKERASKNLASLLKEEIASINKMHKPNVEHAGFAVLKSPSIPSVLVETAFLSNPQEERKLHDPEFQQRMARAIANGLKKYKERYEVEDDATEN